MVKIFKKYLNMASGWLFFRTLTAEALASQIKDKTQRDSIRREVIGEVVLLWERDMTKIGILAQDFSELTHFKAGVLALVVPLAEPKPQEPEAPGQRMNSGSMRQ